MKKLKASFLMKCLLMRTSSVYCHQGSQKETEIIKTMKIGKQKKNIFYGTI